MSLRTTSCVLTILLWTLFSYAESPQPKMSPFQYCEEDGNLFCADKKGLSDLGACLLAHQDKLSTACKQDIERYIQFRNQATSRGGGALSSFGGLNAVGPPVPLVSYEGRYSPGTRSPTFTENKANISVPIFRKDADAVSLSLAGGLLHLGEPVALNTGVEVPTDLYRVELGAHYFHTLANRKNLSLRTSVGYAGDQPFKNAKDTTYSINANYGFPGSQNGYWWFSVFFSNNSPIGNYIPIPGAAYIYKTETFSGVFGFPMLSMQWTPVFPWYFSLLVFGPTLQSEVGYGSIEHFQLFTGFYWIRQSYVPYVRNNDRDRLTTREMKAALGIRTLFWTNTLSELQVGRAFNRSIYIGNGLFKQDGGVATISDDWFVLWSVKVKL